MTTAARVACVRCSATGLFEPCCSSHDALMCHLCYRLTHFVEVCGCPTCLADGLPRILGERQRWANRPTPPRFRSIWKNLATGKGLRREG